MLICAFKKIDFATADKDVLLQSSVFLSEYDFGAAVADLTLNDKGTLCKNLKRQKLYPLWIAERL